MLKRMESRLSYVQLKPQKKGKEEKNKEQCQQTEN